MSNQPKFNIGFAPGCERCPFRSHYEQLFLNKQYRKKIEQVEQKNKELQKKLDKVGKKEQKQ
jgi:hypothetical protein